MFEWIGFAFMAGILAWVEWSREPHSGSLPSGFLAPLPVLGTLGYLLGGSEDWLTLQEIVGFWLVTAAGFTAGFLRDRFKQSTLPTMRDPSRTRSTITPSKAPGRLPTPSEMDDMTSRTTAEAAREALEEEEERRKRWGRGMVATLIEEEREVKAELRRGTPISEIVKKLNARAVAKPSLPPPNVVVGPTKVSGGVVARVIGLPNGGGRLEIWEYGKGWVDGVGKVTPDELMPGAGKPVSAADAARLGIPASELTSSQSRSARTDA